MFGLYIHWPFCKSRCPYCDYNAHVRERVDVNAFGEALLTELDFMAREAGERVLTSIFFGGGTPSLMPAQLVEKLIARAGQYFKFASDIEITLEANPTSSEAAHFKDLRRAGVGRLSMGIQSLNDADLKFLGRSHSAEEAKSAVSVAAGIFPRYSFDLIYARPNQSVESWTAELESALALARDHFSFYQLSVEPQTAFAISHARGDFILPDDDHAAMLYDATLEILGARGFNAYEVSSFARNGDECRHNLCYWRYHDYIGVGCGAHGRVTLDGEKYASRNVKMPEAWQKKVTQDGNGRESFEAIGAKDRALEMIMMNLRLQEGIDKKRFAAECGADVYHFLDQKSLPALIEQGFLINEQSSLRTTAKGRNCLNELTARIIRAD